MNTTAESEASAGQSAVSRIFPSMGHVGIVVPDAGKAAEALIEQFELERASLIVDTIAAVEGATYKGKKVDFASHVTIVELGNTQIEYLAPVSGESPYADALAGGQESCIHHVAHVVTSIEDQLTKARERNLEVDIVLDAPIGDIGRYVYVDGIVPGSLVEFIEFFSSGHAD